MLRRTSFRSLETRELDSRDHVQSVPTIPLGRIVASFAKPAFARIFEISVRRPEQEQNGDGVESRDVNRGFARHVGDPHLGRPK